LKDVIGADCEARNRLTDGSIVRDVVAEVKALRDSLSGGCKTIGFSLNRRISRLPPLLIVVPQRGSLGKTEEATPSL
jgi:hypothetical protein